MRYGLVIMISLGMILTAGCATVGERQAFEQLAAVERTPYTSGTLALTRQDLPTLNEQSSLSDYLAYAALNNPGLQAALYRWKAALVKIPQERSLPDPMFTYRIEDVESRLGRQDQKFALSQTFPWFGKLTLQGEMALEAANAERERYESAKLKLFYQVKNAYYEYYYLAREIAIAEENVELLTYFEDVARTRYKVDATTYDAVIKAQVELGKQEDSLRSLRDLREPLSAKLDEALNRPRGAPLPLPQLIPEESVTLSNEQLLAWLAESNPELRALSVEAAKEKVGIDLAKKIYYPDITLGVEYTDKGEPAAPGMTDSNENSVAAMISLNIPIWFNKYRAKVKEAQARYSAALNERSERENNLTSDLKMAFYGFRDAERKINLYRDTLVPKAEQSLKVTLKTFTAGKADFLDVIDTQRVLLEFKLSYERALADRAERLAEVEMLVGKEVPRVTASAAAVGMTKPEGAAMSSAD
jgi:cobalt-zinc-cadmium efflux system outer membrane protein